MSKIQELAVVTSLLIGLSGCDYSVQAGEGDGGRDASATQQQVDLPEHSPCQCFDLDANCCASGLFCFAANGCNVKLDGGGCFSQGTCTRKRALGEPCTDQRQCAEALASCSGPSSGPATCKVSSVDLDAQRCESSAQCSAADGIRRVCSDTYCKRMAGEACDAWNQCASNKCYGSIVFHCL